MPKRQYHIVEGEIIGETSGGVRTDYLTDALGSVTGTVNQSTQVRNTYRWKPYGSLLASTGADPDPGVGWNGTWGYRPTGRLRASHYVVHRHYDQLSGQWTAVDPLERFSLHWYCDQNPSTLVDPLGLHTCDYPRTNECLPDIRPYDVKCGSCTLERITAQGHAVFSMTLPRRARSVLVYGELSVNYSHELAYRCNDGTIKYRYISGLFSVPATSAGAEYGSQVYGTWRQTNHIIPPTNMGILSLPWKIELFGCRDIIPESLIPATIYGGEQYIFGIKPHSRFGRSAFGVHPDGNEPGTLGCITPRRMPIDWNLPKRVRSCFLNLKDYGLMSLPLEVRYQ
ncbi:MAG: hypothetical protein HONBIEJF_02590 [Fimbriimonadaceae bacterium]|nr:hypothetical protein [Fimbriimonadaceae bacterium]